MTVSTFQPLSDLLQTSPEAGSISACTSQDQNVEEPISAAVASIDAQRPFGPDAIIADVARARLAALEAYERATQRLLEAFAAEVLGRELRLAAVDIAAVRHEALQIFGRYEPVRLRVAASEADAAQCDLPVVGDEALSPGDLLLEVRDGLIDLRLPLRVRGVMQAVLG